ncbi:hypothetical protein Amsp01_042900 [Amycolatopsis sp. NBRC 101858]|uniref:hypothetical protein n=1 Tax=Amycolatopsis sp. NBRC 101858 TaxID=3032200 RepID=UPI00249F9FFF|nr:hypothetical protein [Amycolatopsis sp. NBRC 101858]GLY38266.1 hypothetical protein Amsp01_042900 [Amycolatopsis sp. NBRC 101858]
MNDYLSLLPSTLQWVSNRLGAVSDLPWPLWIGLLFPVYVAVISVVIWLLRGRVWVVHCAYPKTSRGWDCRNWVPGEWSRCRHHNRRRTYGFGHSVNPDIQRWQTFGKGDVIIDRPERGVGLLRLRPTGATLLYQRGYPRPPLLVLRQLPAAAVAAWRRIRQARIKRPADRAQVGVRTDFVRTDVAEGLERVVAATRFAMVAFVAAIVLTGVAVLLDGAPQTVLQYLATLGFVLAWAATSSGIYGRSELWLRGACLKGLKWWFFIFVPVGVLNLVFTVVNKTPA